MASGNYYNAGSGQGPIFNTDLAGLWPSANTLILPANVTSLPGPGGANRLQQHQQLPGRLNLSMQRVFVGK
jgi:hypothetical protein